MNKSTILFLLLFVSFQSNAIINFEYDLVSDKYSARAEGISVFEFLSKFSYHSGINVYYDKTIDNKLPFNLILQTEKQIIDFLGQEYSTVKSYGKNKKLISIKILPEGQYQTDFLQQALNEEVALYNYQINDSSINDMAIQRFQMRMSLLPMIKKDKVERWVSERQKTYSDNERRKIADRNEKLKERNSIVNELVKIKNTSQEKYKRRLSIVEWRFKGLANEVNEKQAEQANQ